MSHQTRNQAEVEDRLWNEVQKHQIGMLGVLGDNHHFQPMTAFAEPETGQIWFFTYRNTDLGRSAEAGGPAAFIFQTKDVYACIDGALSADHDQGRIEKYWNAHVAAWYPEGKDDPRLTMLRLDCSEAAVWLTDVGPVRYAWEIMRANAQDRTPDVGGRTDVNLH